MGVIFVAGVHAVGKTTACTHAARNTKLVHFTASSLIKAEKASAIPETGKAVADLEGNQDLLIRGVQRSLLENNGRIILDGHFTLPTFNGQIEAIGLDVFRALTLEYVVVYHDEPAAIAARLCQRDGETRHADAIAHHQDAELAAARAVTAELGLPLRLLAAFDSISLIKVISQWS